MARRINRFESNILRDTIVVDPVLKSRIPSRSWLV